MQKLLEFLLSLNHVSINRNTRFGFGVDWRLWIIPAVIVLGLLGWWSYRRQSTSSQRRLTLGILRGVLLAVVFLLFCRPELVVERENITKSVVAIWVDTSMSMTLEDPYVKDLKMHDWAKGMLAQNPLPAGQTRLMRYQLAVDSLANAKWIKTLAETQDVEFFTGYTHAQSLGTAHAPEQVQGFVDKLKQITPTGDSTDVPTVVQEIMQKVQGTRLSGIILLTDGQTTEAGSRPDQTVGIAQRAGTKIFSLPLGQAEEPYDLALENMQSPKFAFARDPVSIKMRLSGAGIDKPTLVRVSLFRKEGAKGSETLTPLVDGEGKPVSKEFTLDPAKKVIDIEEIFKPTKKPGEEDEKYDIVGTVEAVGAPVEELNTANNIATATTTIKDAQINVLYVDDTPRWEFRYLKNELIREKTVNVSTYQVSADEDFAQEGDKRVEKNGKETFPGPITHFPETKEELDKYDVILIGDVDPTFFSPTQQRLIVDFVRKSGGGIGWIAGQNYNPESYKGTLLEPLLPVVPDELDPRARVMPTVPNEPFTLVLTAAGKDSNLFRFFDDPDLNVKQMGELPEMYWYKPVQGLQPAAKVLAVHSTRSQGGSPVPLIVTGRYGNGRTLFSAVCDTWRWRRYNGEPLFQSYWLQMCRLLCQGKKLEQKGLELTPESDRVEVGRPLKITLDITDPTLAPLVPAQVPVTIMDKDGRVVETVTLQHVTGDDSQERLEGITTASQMGNLTLNVAPGILPLNLAPVGVTVEHPQQEFETITADMESLGTLATKTTGAVVPLYEAEDLSKQVPDRSLPTLDTQSEELWYKPIALILVVGLVTIEWLLRKRAGLI